MESNHVPLRIQRYPITAIGGLVFDLRFRDPPATDEVQFAALNLLLHDRSHGLAAAFRGQTGLSAAAHFAPLQATIADVAVFDGTPVVLVIHD